MKLLFSVFLSGLLILPVVGQKNILNSEIDSVSYSLGILLGTSIRQAGSFLMKMQRKKVW